MHTLANIEDITPDEMLHYLLYQTRRTNPMVHNVLKQCIRALYACRTSGLASVNTDSQWIKREARFAHATQGWSAVNHNTTVTFGE